MCSLCKVSAWKQKVTSLHCLTIALLYGCKRYIISTQHSWSAASVVSEAHVGCELKRSVICIFHIAGGLDGSVCIGLWWLQCPVLFAAAASENTALIHGKMTQGVKLETPRTTLTLTARKMSRIGSQYGTAFSLNQRFSSCEAEGEMRVIICNKKSYSFLGDIIISQINV